VSTEQDENLNRIVDWHNSLGPHDYDVSVHFNDASSSDAHGTEVWFETQGELAAELSEAMSDAALFTDRGAKYADGSLFFLRETIEPSVLLEVCFVNNQNDVDLYHKHFDALINALATTLAGNDEIDEPPAPELPAPDSEVLFYVRGTCSWFGGPLDEGVAPDEGLAFIYEYEQRPDLFLPKQPEGTTGLARRLDGSKPYVACRWDYDVTPKDMLADATYRALVRSYKTGLQAMAWPADWGPHEGETGRAVDLSPGLMEVLGLETDDEVEVLYPAPSLIV